MSTITVVKKNGYLEIAADSLSIWGSSKDPAHYVLNHQKILKVGESYVAICGATSLKIVLNDYFAAPEIDLNLDSVQAIFRVWKRLHEVLKEEYFLNPDEDDDASFESSRMEVLIANEHGIFGVTAHRAVQEFSRFYAYGNGRDYAMGAMYVSFEDETKAAEDIARLGVQGAAEFDDSTGLPVTSFGIAQPVIGLDSPMSLSTHNMRGKVKNIKASRTKAIRSISK